MFGDADKPDARVARPADHVDAFKNLRAGWIVGLIVRGIRIARQFRGIGHKGTASVGKPQGPIDLIADRVDDAIERDLSTLTCAFGRGSTVFNDEFI